MGGVRLLERTIRDGDCLIWQGSVQSSGYGCVAAGAKGKNQLAHRAAWVALNGPIADGMTIDHLCRNKLCLNTDHMEVVTRGENVRRMLALRTHCKHGHLVAGENLRVQERANGRTYRICVTCQRAFKREHMKRARDAGRVGAQHRA